MHVRNKPNHLCIRPEVYSQDAITKLTRDYNITDQCQIVVLKDRLEAAAHIYQSYEEHYRDSARPSKSKAVITEIKSHVDELRRLFGELDGATARKLWFPEIEVDGFATSGEIPKNNVILKSPYGHTITKQPIDNDSCTVSYLSIDNHLESLEILQNYCDEALDHIPVDKGAARKSKSVLMWLIKVRELWIEGLGRKFTRDSVKSGLVSEAARFCYDALKVIDPNIKSRTVNSSMKLLITAANKHQSGKNTPSK